MTTLTKTVGNMTVNLLKTASEQEKQGLIPIKNKIIENIILYQRNEQILAKYLWLNEFIKWYEKDVTGNLKFHLMTEKYNKNENN